MKYLAQKQQLSCAPWQEKNKLFENIFWAHINVGP